jgi:hypothetical protein
MTSLQSTTPSTVAQHNVIGTPDYFARGGIETLDYLRAKLGDDGYEAYLVGMTHKKMHKAFLGPVQARDATYQKAAVYLARLLHLRANLTPDQPDHGSGPVSASGATSPASNGMAGGAAPLQRPPVAAGSTPDGAAALRQFSSPTAVPAVPSASPPPPPPTPPTFQQQPDPQRY